jgi:phosphotransferase family enzyme
MNDVVLEQPATVFFAPSLHIGPQGTELLVTRGRRNDLRFHDGAPSAAGSPAVPRWFVGGRNAVCWSAGTASGPAAVVEHPGTGLAGLIDFTGACQVDTPGGGRRMWFSARAEDGPWSIYVTESSDGRTWSPARIALAPGPSTESEHVMLPCVVRDGARWLMYYAGRDGSHRRIHLAVSDDGWSWTRNGVVLDRGQPGELDEYAADCPCVLKVAEGEFVMAYGAGSSRSIAAAVSADGLTWKKRGQVKGRGPAGAIDSQYAFYPWLLPAADGLDLFYAGEDDDGCWRIVSGPRLDPSVWVEAADDWVDPTVITRLAGALEDIDPTFLQTSSDAHAETASFTSSDDSVRQLRPSSGPVFLVRGESAQHVVKLGRSPDAVHREVNGASILRAHLPLLPCALRFVRGQPVAVMPWVDARTAATVARADPERFRQVLVDFLPRFAGSLAATAEVADPGSVDWTGQSPEVLLSWLDDIETLAGPWLDLQPALNGVPGGETLRVRLQAARLELMRQPRRTALGTGDTHLNNVLVGAERYWVIDLEYAGRFDIDYLVAKLWLSCLKHTGLLDDARVTVTASGLETSVGLRSRLARELLTGTLLTDCFRGLPLSPARVCAYMLAKLRFRFDSQPQPPGLALAATMLSRRLTDALVPDGHSYDG